MILATILMLPAAGCVSTGSNDLQAACDATLALRRAHASALVADGGDLSVVTGMHLLAAQQAACLVVGE